MMTSVFLFFDVSGGELMVVILFALMFFGSKKIPELARSLGKGIREIKDASNAVKREIQKGADEVKKEVDPNKELEL